jgi:hypothetical protein
MAIDKTESFRRLSFIKYLFDTGVEQSNKPEPLCNVAMLSFHDSIELFLQLACEHQNIDTTKANFMDYFDKLEQKVNISQKESMRRFNKTRVNLKHHGTMVSKLDIDYFKASCLNFFTDNVKSIFDIDFESISLINLVALKAVKEHLEKAELETSNGNYKNAICEITIAFWQMLEEYEENKTKYYGHHSPFFFGSDMTFHKSFFMKIDNDEISKFIDDVQEAISAMQSAIKILSFGFDYRKFTKFNLLTPGYVKTFGGFILNEKNETLYTVDNIKWCCDFVIECCILLQNFDYNYKA